MKNKSFTLIELLVVIVIIGILAGVIIVSVSSSIGKANFAKAQAFSNTAQNELLGDLVSEWTFNSPAVSEKTEDSWGNNDGTLIGANGLPELQTKENCVYGTCYSFDGTDDYIDSGLKDIDSDITLASWFYLLETQATTAKGFIGIRDETLNQRMYLGVAGGTRQAYFSVGNSASIISNDLDLNKWYFAVAQFNDLTGEMKLYVDGSLIGTGTGSRTNSNRNYAIGAIMNATTPSNATYLKGRIDDVRLYNAVLSSAQIKQQYVAGLNSLLAKGSISKEEYEQGLNNLAYEK